MDTERYTRADYALLLVFFGVCIVAVGNELAADALRFVGIIAGVMFVAVGLVLGIEPLNCVAVIGPEREFRSFEIRFQ